MKFIERTTGKNTIKLVDIDINRSKAALLFPIDFGIYLFDNNINTNFINDIQKYGLAVIETKKTWSGPYIDRAPDLIVLPNPKKGVTISSRFLKG